MSPTLRHFLAAYRAVACNDLLERPACRGERVFEEEGAATHHSPRDTLSSLRVPRLALRMRRSARPYFSWPGGGRS